MSSYFSGEKRGELNQMRLQLNSKSQQTRKGALKKVIAAMTIGRDVSSLFHDVIKCLMTGQLDTRKLVYLYVINTSRLTPTDAMMVINHLRKDVVHKSNPIIRALALRTMGYLRVQSLNDYLVDPLLQGLKDTDPYVRKTAVICVAKHGQYQTLIDFIIQLFHKQSNSLVLANLIQTLNQISSMRGKKYFILNGEAVKKLLLVLNQTMQWAQISILDSIALYIPQSQTQAQMIIQQVMPRINHINPAVTLSGIKVVLSCLPYVKNQVLVKGICKKISPTLQSLSSIQKQSQSRYVVLSNMHYVIETYPNIFQGDIKKFYVKYLDPPYIKKQKLDILVRIVNQKNYQQLLNQLKEYLYQTDQEYVSQVIKALAKVIVQFQRSVQKGLYVLSRFMDDVAEHPQYGQLTVNTIVISIQHILRKYPSKYNFNGMFLNVIKLMLRTTNPQATQAAIWINGQYAQQIYPQSIAFIQQMIKQFEQSDPTMQLELITSAVKVFIKYPEDGKQFIIPLLSRATQKVQNADVRDRAFLYWRMLSVDPQRTRQIVFTHQRPNIKEDDALLQKEFVQMAINNLGMFNTVFKKTPQNLFPKSISTKLNIVVQQKEEIQVAKIEDKKATKREQYKQQKKQQQPVQKEQPKKKIEQVELL